MAEARELVNETTGQVLATDARLAENLWSRAVGLIGRSRLPRGFALGISHCDWVHTFGVLVPLDIVYCARDGQVLRVVPDLRPGRFAARARGAFWSWEAPAGRLAPSVRIGDRLIVRETDRQRV